MARGDDAIISDVPAVARQRGAKDADLLALEQDLSGRLGLKVTITTRGAGGTLAIQYRSLDQLDDVLQRLGINE
ncbi:hypothetical protein CCP1ISM_8570001 [Azospirillaceae bacterium]